MSAATEYLGTLPFAPDPFQVQAARAIDAGSSVVVTAPTGAGKTVVAEAAIRSALEREGRAFYTTPIKALSNQKFGDLRREYGNAAVGLLTGDNSINGLAPIVVMTTEVLRNMIYEGSADLDDVAVVVLDEVHYLQDPTRGAVWEEVIIHLRAGIPLVCLSATIANAEEFTAWVQERRGRTELVVAVERPVPLETFYLATDRHHPGEPLLEPVFANGRPNPRLAKLLRPGRNRRRRFGTPRRGEVVEVLAALDRLPAIYFVFSRKGCEAAADRVADQVRLTTPDEAQVITSIATERTGHIPERDLAALGFGRWVQRLARGVAAHHAGIVPAFKETVEELFAGGLLKVVFATETLALGINMPARTVVLESLSKFTGEGHELLQPGDFTQLTGRAGRRGIDESGTAVVLHSGFVPFDRVAGIAAAGSHPLRSSFRPTYNMAVNLIASYPRSEAETLLEASFGQFQQQRRAAQFEERIAATAAELAEARRLAECELLDVWAVLEEQPAHPSHGSRMRRFASQLAAGDVLEMSGSAGPERHVLLARGTGSNPRLLVLATDAGMRRIKPEELPPGTRRVGTMDLPEPFEPRTRSYRSQAAAALREWTAGPRQQQVDALAAYGPGEGEPACPDLEQHLEFARAARRLEADLRRLRRRRRQATGGLVTTFHALVGLLADYGYVDGWSLTTKGERLRRIYNELDLRVVEAIDGGLFDDLDAAELTALVSAFVFEPRADNTAMSWPTADLRDRGARLGDLDHELSLAEEELGLAVPRPPHGGFAEIAYAWSLGIDLDDVLATETSPGDLVRNCRQVLDLLRQIGDAFPEMAQETEAAAKSIDRGVVAAGGME